MQVELTVTTADNAPYRRRVIEQFLLKPLSLKPLSQMSVRPVAMRDSKLCGLVCENEILLPSCLRDLKTTTRISNPVEISFNFPKTFSNELTSYFKILNEATKRFKFSARI